MALLRAGCGPSLAADRQEARAAAFRRGRQPWNMVTRSTQTWLTIFRCVCAPQPGNRT